MSARIIQVRPSRNPRWQKQDGWEVFEADRFLPLVWKQYAHTGARATDFQARANTPLSTPTWLAFEPARASVPDTGATVMLLGAALGMLGVARRFIMT